MYSKTGFALRYPNGSLAGIDPSSGGYPYEARDIRDVWIDSEEKVKNYIRHGSEGLSAVPVTVDVRVEEPKGPAVHVIVSRCEQTGDRVYGPRLVEQTFQGVNALAEAQMIGSLLCHQGLSVIVRPNYNEVYDGVHGYREWRSFNGEKLKEIRFYIPKK